jgi:murein L,D-transpeptidase YcbB/YkuD
MRRYPTPTGDYTITDVQWNPWWYPPESPWAEKDTITPPGPGNPMGKVKLPLGSLLFVHGTPRAESIGKAASHACIRMRNADAIALARLVQASAGTMLAEPTLDSLLRRSERIALPVAVPVRIVYDLVERRADTLVFHPDVYRRGRESVTANAMFMLAAAGYDTARVNRDLLERAVSDGARLRTKIEIGRLITP